MTERQVAVGCARSVAVDASADAGESPQLSDNRTTMSDASRFARFQFHAAFLQAIVGRWLHEKTADAAVFSWPDWQESCTATSVRDKIQVWKALTMRKAIREATTNRARGGGSGR
jgi:hypothetical protein